MIETLSPKKELEDLQADLREVQELLRRHRLVERLVERQEMPKHALVESLVHRQNVAELRSKLDSMHPADIAYVLESLPLEERLVVWNLVKAERDGEILLQASDAVRETLIRSMDLQELVAAAEQLEADEIADLAPDLPEGVIHDVFQALPVEEREQLRAAMSYPEDAVGALIDFDVVSVREDTAIATVTRYLRRLARDRRLRTLDREAGGARRADAYRRGNRRKFWQPDHHPDRALDRARPSAKGARKEVARKGTRRLASERPHLGERARPDRLLALSEGVARSGNDGGDDAESRSFSDRRSADSAHHDAARARSGAGVLGHDHGDHRQRRVFHFPRLGDAFSGLTGAYANRR